MNKSIVKKQRYSIRLTTNGKIWSSLCGKNGNICYFASLTDARNYVPTVWANIPDILGVTIATETYWTEQPTEGE